MLIALPGIHARLGDTLAEAWSNLRSQGRRSALALLGIMIGTASIIAMLNGGHMAQRESLKLFAKLGVDMLQVGAAPTDIRLLFLVEAVVLTIAGGAIGSALGAAIAWAMAHSSGWDFDLAPWTLALGPAAAGGMGLAFGLYPAIAASRLSPIEALRAD